MKVKLLRSKKNELQLVDAKSHRLDEANDFLDTLRTRGLSPHTVRAYAYDLQAIFAWLHSPHQIRVIERPELYEFIERQRACKSSPRTINRKLATLGLFYRFATGRNLAASVPCSGYRAHRRDRTLGVHRITPINTACVRVKVPKKLITPLSTAQVQLLLAQFARYRDLALCYFMLLCGLRAQEVLSIMLSDLSTHDRTLLVHGKGNKERVLPVPEVLTDVLAKYLSFERPADCSTNAIFVVLQGARRGHPMTISGLSEVSFG